MGFVSMIAMSAPVPEGIFDASMGLVPLALVVITFAIGALGMLSAGGSRSVWRSGWRSPRQVPRVQHPAFGVAR